MIGMVYALMLATTALIVAAGVAILRDRRLALLLLCLGILTGVGAAIASLNALNDEIGPTGYARVRAAAAKDPGTDAMAQWALEDDAISLSEYTAIADAYRRGTGRDINEETAR